MSSDPSLPPPTFLSSFHLPQLRWRKQINYRPVLPKQVPQAHLVPTPYSRNSEIHPSDRIPEGQNRIKDAYLHIPVYKLFLRFLAVRWKNLGSQFKAIPFGLSIASAVFSSMMNFSLKLLRNSCPVHSLSGRLDYFKLHPIEAAS